jgi:hypothetical protein
MFCSFFQMENSSVSSLAVPRTARVGEFVDSAVSKFLMSPDLNGGQTVRVDDLRDALQPCDPLPWSASEFVVLLSQCIASPGALREGRSCSAAAN